MFFSFTDCIFCTVWFCKCGSWLYELYKKVCLNIFKLFLCTFEDSQIEKYV